MSSAAGALGYLPGGETPMLEARIEAASPRVHEGSSQTLLLQQLHRVALWTQETKLVDSMPARRSMHTL